MFYVSYTLVIKFFRVKVDYLFQFLASKARTVLVQTDDI